MRRGATGAARGGRAERPDGGVSFGPAAVGRTAAARGGGRAPAGTRLSGRPRLLFALAALLLVPAFLLPLWSVTLRAPQYPEGLGMNIHVHEVVGHTEHDLQNINILNHYIGMQPIEPDAIPELRYMPWILGAFVALGLAGAAGGRRWMLTAWLALLVVAGVVGLADFFHWKIEFGHNLSPDAPIKVPGMTYTPPFIGSKQLLNITASSWPSWGSLFLGLSVLAAAAARWRARSRSRNGPALAVALGLALVLPLAGCAPEAGAEAGREARGSAAAHTGEASEARLPLGVDVCAYCGEIVGTQRYGGELITRDGEVRRFMSVECLAGFLLTGSLRDEEIASLRVVDFNHGSRLIEARTAIYLRSDNRPSPMGANILAVESARVADNLHFAFGGTLMDWKAVLEAVAGKWDL